LSRLFIALPVLNENEHLPEFMTCVSNQTYRDFVLFVCVNQPDEWWDDPEKVIICKENQKTLTYLKTIPSFNIVIIDKSSKGKGWREKRHGVGWARKTLMDAINAVAGENDIMVSLDADTTFSENYFYSLATTFLRFPDATGLAVPYFHKSVPDEKAYRAILRYEIYMRYYSINLWRIGSPYTFTALGSAMACPVRAYRAAGGMTPKMSGEDFYFLQKLRKTGRLLFWNEEKVYPEARFSDRVYFGTGPAMIKGNQGDWSSYPLYRWQFFNEIQETYELFSSFLKHTQTTKVTEFLRMQCEDEDPFEPLRNNFHNENQFIRACHEKFDGLRILQYLKTRQKEDPAEDEISLIDFLIRFYPKEIPYLRINPDNFTFEKSDLKELENIRMFLFRKEEEYQINSTLA
jgi:glycosyltransferase involved in cell wall biosynthesis